MVTAPELIAMATNNMFGRPLVTNVYRSVLVEAMVAAALPEWEWCSADYSPFDFRHPDGSRLEVKQSALKQTWASPGQARASWDIRARAGRYDGAVWIAEPGRNADIYVLALHPLTDETADHREAEQWRFHVVLAEALPPIKRLSAVRARELSALVTFNDLASLVETCRTSLRAS